MGIKSKSWLRSLSILVSVLTMLTLLIRIGQWLRGRLKMTSSPTKAIQKTFKGTEFESLTPYVIAQAKHETGGYNTNVSKPLKYNNNMFGMNRPKTRITTDNGKGNLVVEGSVMANYDSLEDSARDLLLWLRQWKSSPFPTTITSAWQYANELKGANKGRLNYYEDSIDNYSKGLSAWL